MVVLTLVGIATNQIGLELFYGTRFYLGSCFVVLALLLLGQRGLLVGAASILLVPRLWQEPSTMVFALLELLWLKLFLDHVGDPVGRKDSGSIVLADILFWILIAIPLHFLLIGVIANLDFGGVFNVSLRLAVNGAFNAVIAFALYVLIRLAQARRDRSRSCGVHGLTFITLLVGIVLASLICLGFSVRQLNHQLIATELSRLRQAAAMSTSVQASGLAQLASVRRRAGSLLEFQVLDGGGRLLYDSNPALFDTLDHHYATPSHQPLSFPVLPDPLDLMVPAPANISAPPPLNGYWRYSSSLDRGPRDGDSPLLSQDRVVVMVEPAKAQIRQLQAHSDGALDLLGLILILGALVAERVAQLVERQFPELPALPSTKGPGFTTAALAPVTDVSPLQLVTSTSLISELQGLLEVLRSSDQDRVNLRDELRRSEKQRRRLEEEVTRLNILDPLTGCFNRRELYRRLDHELSLASRVDRELCFLCLEVDHLRRIHDSYGAAASEEILRRVATEIRNRSRTTDLVCRLSEDQFALLLPACGAVSAQQVGELINRSVSALEIRHEDSLLAVTLSVGVTALQARKDDPESLITRAQSALYRAKAEGRNRVVLI